MSRKFVCSKCRKPVCNSPRRFCSRCQEQEVRRSWMRLAALSSALAPTQSRNIPDPPGWEAHLDNLAWRAERGLPLFGDRELPPIDLDRLTVFDVASLREACRCESISGVAYA